MQGDTAKIVGATDQVYDGIWRGKERERGSSYSCHSFSSAFLSLKWKWLRFLRSIPKISTLLVPFLCVVTASNECLITRQWCCWHSKWSAKVPFFLLQSLKNESPRPLRPYRYMYWYSIWSWTVEVGDNLRSTIG